MFHMQNLDTSSSIRPHMGVSPSSRFGGPGAYLRSKVA